MRFVIVTRPRSSVAFARHASGGEVADEPATLEVGSIELAVERLRSDAPELDGLAFFCLE